MPFAEVIYEPGSKSVVHYDDVEKLKAGLKEHNDRAKSGAYGGPAGGPAERVTKVILYSTHPAEFRADNKVSVEILRNLITGMAGDHDSVDANQLISAIRDETSPTFPLDQGRHESMYKMTGTELDLSFLNGVGT